MDFTTCDAKTKPGEDSRILCLEDSFEMVLCNVV